MAATPYPTNLCHSDTAQALLLNAQVEIPPTGDMELVVAGNAFTSGWPVIPDGQKMVVTVARDTVYEKKYLISSITSGTYISTFEILAADREYDGLQPTSAPAGATVEHTISAVEIATINDHMRTKLAHGSNGELVDEDSVQTLTNKTITGSTVAGYLPLAGGTMTGNLSFSKANPYLYLTATSGTARIVMTRATDELSGIMFMQPSGSLRWLLFHEDDDTLRINRYNSGGVVQSCPLRISPTTGDITVGGKILGMDIGLTWQFNVIGIDASTNLRYSTGLSQGSQVTITGADSDTLSVAAGYIYRVRANVFFDPPPSTSQYVSINLLRNGGHVHQAAVYAYVPASNTSTYTEWTVPTEATLTEDAAATYQIQVDGNNVADSTNSVTVTIIGYAP